MQAQDTGMQVAVQIIAGIIDKGGEDNGGNHEENDLKDLRVAFFLAMPVSGGLSMENGAIHQIDKDHKGQTGQHTGAGSQGSAYGSIDGSSRPPLTGKGLDEEPGRQHADDGIDYLLCDLRDGSRRHGVVSLKIPPQDAQNCGKENGRSQYLQSRGCILLVGRKQDAASEEGHQGRNPPH